MEKVAIIVLADTETHGDMGRISNALETVKEFKESNKEVKLIFDGAGVKWIGKLSDPSSNMNAMYKSVEDKIGVCGFCAQAFGVKEQVLKAGIPLVEEFEGHPSIKTLVEEDYQVITF